MKIHIVVFCVMKRGQKIWALGYLWWPKNCGWQHGCHQGGSKVSKGEKPENCLQTFTYAIFTNCKIFELLLIFSKFYLFLQFWFFKKSRERGQMPSLSTLSAPLAGNKFAICYSVVYFWCCDSFTHSLVTQWKWWIASKNIKVNIIFKS